MGSTVKLAPLEFRAIRNRLGISADKMADVLGLSSGRSVRRYEAGEREVSGPVAVLAISLIEVPGMREHRGLPPK